MQCEWKDCVWIIEVVEVRPVAGDVGAYSSVTTLRGNMVDQPRLPMFAAFSGQDAEVRTQSGLQCRFVRGVPNFGIAPAWSVATKRTLDVVLGASLLAVASPILAAVAVAVKFSSPGPVIFRQPRYGRDGKPFEILKFRTFYADAMDRSGVRQTAPGDARITPLGRLLRRSNLDELPQLINIIRGDMSLCGPRPHPIGMLAGGLPYEQLVPYYHRRHSVRPGLTGWAQANGLRGPTTDPQKAVARLEHDMAYIQNMSLRLDLIILWRTIVRELTRASGQ